jgi:hypothetical protein
VNEDDNSEGEDEGEDGGEDDVDKEDNNGGTSFGSLKGRG